MVVMVGQVLAPGEGRGGAGQGVRAGGRHRLTKPCSASGIGLAEPRIRTHFTFFYKFLVHCVYKCGTGIKLEPNVM